MPKNGTRSARHRLVFGCSTLVMAAFATQADAQPMSEGATLSEVVVTAQKREQNLQDVPISVTAVTQDALEGNRITTITDLQTLVPNVAFRVIAGGSGIAGFSMRGLETVGTAPGRDKAISPYVDGVYIGAGFGTIFDLPDLERIEVLRGPQGTLFGRNSTAGAISIITRDPSGEFHVRQQFSYGNYSQFRSSTRIETPSLGPFSASVSYTHNERDGDMKNLGAGQFWDRTRFNLGTGVSPKRLGDQNTESVFVAVKFEPNDALRATYKFDWTESDFTPEGTGLVSYTPSSLAAAVAPTFIANFNANPPPFSGRHRPKYVNNSAAVPGNQKVYGHNFTILLNITDSLSLKNIMAHRYADVAVATQIDGVGGLRNVVAAAGPLGSPYVGTFSQAVNRDLQWTEELQLNFQSKLLTLTTGALYYRSKGSSGDTIDGMFSVRRAFVVVPNGVVQPAPLVRNSVRAKSLAGYAQAEVHILPNLDIVGGARVTKDKKIGLTFQNGVPFNFTYSNTKPNYLVGVNYKPTEDILLYGKYANAFVSGGSSFGVVYAPETVRSVEAGLKADLLDRKVRFNMAVWRARYLNQQSATLGVNIGRPDIPGAVLVSFGDITAKGFEGELTVAPARGLRFNGGLGFTDFELTRVNPLLGTLQTTLLQRRPRWTANLAGQYETEPLFADATLTFRADASWRSKIYTLSPLPIRPQDQIVAFSPASWLVNSRISLQGVKVGRGDIEIAAWAKNIFDNDYPVQPIFFGYAVSSSYERARTFGIDLIYNY